MSLRDDLINLRNYFCCELARLGVVGSHWGASANVDNTTVSQDVIGTSGAEIGAPGISQIVFDDGGADYNCDLVLPLAVEGETLQLYITFATSAFDRTAVIKNSIGALLWTITEDNDFVAGHMGLIAEAGVWAVYDGDIFPIP